MQYETVKMVKVLNSVQFVSDALSDDVLFNISKGGVFLLCFYFMVINLRNIVHVTAASAALINLGYPPLIKNFCLISHLIGCSNRLSHFIF